MIDQLVDFLATATRSQVHEAFNDARDKAQDLSLDGTDRQLYAKAAAMLKSVLALY